jgi:hypothetical protein
MYSMVYSGFGAASAQTLAAAKASWPRCWGAEAANCHDNPATSSYPGCKAIMRLHDEDVDAYDKLWDDTPYCPDPDKDYSLNLIHLAMIAGGALIGVALTKLLA